MRAAAVAVIAVVAAPIIIIAQPEEHERVERHHRAEAGSRIRTIPVARAYGDTQATLLSPAWMLGRIFVPTLTRCVPLPRGPRVLALLRELPGVAADPRVLQRVARPAGRPLVPDVRADVRGWHRRA